MEVAVQNVELEFKRIANSLQYASHRLDTAMANAAASGAGAPDVYRLVRRLRALQTTLATLEAASTHEDARAAAATAALSTTLLTAAGGMARAYARLGEEVDEEWADAARAVAAAAPEAAAAAVEADVAATAAAAAEAGGGGGGGGGAIGAPSHGAGLSTRRGGGGAAPTKPTGATGVTSNTTSANSGGGGGGAGGGGGGMPADVTEEEFLSVAGSTRGRARLDDVQRALATLVALHKSTVAATLAGQPKPKTRKAAAAAQAAALASASFTRQQLAGHGCKVSGHTGDCVLNTLKALRRIQEHRGSISLVTV